MNSQTIKSVCAVLFFALAGMPVVTKADLVQKDSVSFTHKYEMSVLPPSSAWAWSSSGSSSIVGGVLDQDSPVDDNNYYNGGDGFWLNNFSAATGYTIEARVKIVSQNGIAGAWVLNEIPGDNGNSGILALGAVGTTWGYHAGDYPALDSSSNTDAYHVIRMARLPGADAYKVWRDGALLTPTPIAALATYNTYRNWCFMGDVGGDWGGEALVDYVRLDNTGAYAPMVPEPSSMVLLGSAFVGLLAYAWRKGQ